MTHGGDDGIHRRGSAELRTLLEAQPQDAVHNFAAPHPPLRHLRKRYTRGHVGDLFFNRRRSGLGLVTFYLFTR